MSVDDGANEPAWRPAGFSPQPAGVSPARSYELASTSPAFAGTELEDINVISVYNDMRIPTGRKRGKLPLTVEGYAELDPPNHRLDYLKRDMLDVSELDNDELSFGIPRCDDGKFSARAAWQAVHEVPKRAKTKMHRELHKRVHAVLQQNSLAAVKTIVELATQPYVEDKVRFEASKYIFERLNGKTPEHVVHHQEAPWEQVFSEIQRGPRPADSERLKAIDDGEVQDAEIVESPSRVPRSQ